MGHLQQKLSTFLFSTLFYYSYGCQLEGANWPLPVTESILDTFRGKIIDRGTTNIEGIENNVSFGGALNGGPYVDVDFVNSRFMISTNAAYENFEENETTQSMPITVTFRCTGGSTSILTFVITVIDTNNNAPRFIPSNDFVFTITAPVAPGFEVTGRHNEITVRDIDLTTQRIDFAIEDNPYFEITNDDFATSRPKEFKAMLRTKTLIRTIPEPIKLTISATDVDLTGDPALTTSATVTIIGNRDFELPEEPVFSTAFYLAHYTDDNRIILTEPITLQSGYHELVQFTIEGEFSNNFELVRNGNQVSIRVATPLEGEVLSRKNILLVVRAEREFTSGASATIVIQLPEAVPLEFERAHYEGTIENNQLKVPQMVLTQGYEGTSVSAVVLNELTSNFAAVVQGNLVTLTMTPLDESVISENSFIYVQIVASTERSSATTIVTLEIIKDDNVTPVFNKPIYTGSYNPNTGLTLEQIVLVQGYDGIVSLVLEGDNSNYFDVSRSGNIVTIRASTIPPELYSVGRIVLSLEAIKPRTVGANAAVIITLPEARQLEFEESTYRGSLQNNMLTINPISLRVGYDETVVYTISGDYANYFSVSNVQSRAIINLVSPIPSGVISENNIIILTLTASGSNAVTTITSVLLDIIKDDTTTPVFSRNIYYGTYQGTSNINIEQINLSQGFDGSVTFRLNGDHAQYFEVSNTGNNLVLSLRTPIPEEVIFNEKVLLFNVLAEKALTVGANAAISIRFPSELTDPVVMKFTQNTYTGTIENNALTLENIILSSGYAAGTNFFLTGEYSSYFSLTPINNVILIELLNPLPLDVTDNTFIVLEIEARRERAISVATSVVIDIVKQEIVPPVFTQAYYRGVYNADSGLQFDEVISLVSGYDETVIFQLDGEFAPLFSLVRRDSNSLSITAVGPISNEVLERNSHLLFTVVASKSGVLPVRAAISIDIEKDSIPSLLKFSQDYYMGSIEGSSLTLDEMSLEGYSSDVTYTLAGDYVEYFQLVNRNGIFILQLQSELPVVVQEANNILIFTLSAQTKNTRVHTAIILEIIKNRGRETDIKFEEVYYIGSYSDDGGLKFDAIIKLSEDFSAPVSYSLEGSQAQWFGLLHNENTVSLTLRSEIPNIVLQNNQQLVFAIRADSPGRTSATATIVITIIREGSNYIILGFDQYTYLGTIQNDATNIGPITVIEGYTDDITFGLYGDLARYFTTRRQGAVVNVVIQTPIPAELIPANRIIVLEIRASAPQALTAYATIVFEVIVEDDTPSTVHLAFDAPFYSGSYNAIDGLVMETPIVLAGGHDDSIQFALQGENAQWFSVVVTQNSITLVLSSAIPGAVLINNRQLIFVITAQRPGANTAKATIVISLTDDENTKGTNLGFDRVTYFGTIQNDATNIGSITIIEGYTDDITFGLYGDLARYFTTRRQGAVVNVVIQTPIPAELIPANRIIVLEIRASAPQARTAYATIVFEVIVEDDTPSTVHLAFDAPFYSGSYNAIDGLVMETPIVLAGGHDDSIQFALQGENAQWFSVVVTQNSITLVLSSAIPGAVLMNNRQLIFVITAQRPGANTAKATIVISLTDDENTEGTNLGFDRVTYFGTIQNDATNIGPITIIDGYTDDITFGLYGDLARYFTTRRQGAVVNVVIQTPIPAELIPANRLIVLEIRASAPQALTAYATIVFEVTVEDDTPSTVHLAFDAPFYSGSYNAIDGLVMETPIVLAGGHDDSVQFALQGENAQWFSVVVTQNSITLVLSSAIPGAVLMNNRQLIFVITAQRPGANTAKATIVISLTDDENTEGTNLGFDRVTYFGTIQNDATNIGPITIIDGYTDDITFGLYGDLARYFTTRRQGAVVNVVIQTPIPAELIPANRIIVLEIRASAPQARTAYATILFKVIVEDDTPSTVHLAFDAPFYSGSYNAIDGLVMETPIVLAGGHDDSIQFALQGENAQWFSVVVTQNSITLVLSSAIPGAVLMNNRQLIFVITAQRPGANTAKATIVISLTDDENTEGTNLGFDRVTYFGTIQNDATNIGPITIIDGYTDDITFGLYGDLARYFTTRRQGAVVNVVIQTPIPAELIPANRIIVLEIRASAPQALTAYATIVFEVIVEDDTPSTVHLAFDAPFYSGSYNAIDGLVMETPIVLAGGHDDSIQFALQGENAQWFSLVVTQNSITLVLSSAIPGAVLMNNRQLIFIITAQRPGANTAKATIVISLTNDSQAGDDASFDKVLYEGIIQLNEIQHEVIRLSGYDGKSVDLLGEYSSLFVAYVSDGVVSIQASGSVNLPADVIRLALELHAAGARAVLLLNVIESDVAVRPSVTFSSESYVLTVEIVQTGLIGRVSATADNGEAITYSLTTDNAHLQARLSINNVGELHLSAPANSGVYTFQVIATTVITQATSTATVHLIVEAVTVCGDNDIVVPPLIVLDRDEESAHRNLVVLNSTQHVRCHFSLTNRWPPDQKWLYVDDTGLHTTAIDREHESIAFMALSQVQIELVLHCESDNAIRTKRSERTDWLGPYDYGTNKWILTDSIPYNSRRSFVNLIVNDINDNTPVFIGKAHEPIAVGYPAGELEERILPRSLAELKATDADIGENAALKYWSSESVLAVAPMTGFVHVRSGARLQQDQILTVSATDQNGEGLTGTIQLMIKLLDLNNIVVVTVRDAFLDDEMAVLAKLSDAVGYEVRTLRSVVISDDIDEDVTRNKREADAVAATLRLYVYGLLEREPVVVDRLVADFNNNAAIVSVISIIPLEDHLEDSQINIIERDIGLLVATIILSVLLFILILTIAIWYFLRWRKNRSYGKFTDENSLASRNESIGDLPKSENPMPRLNIEDLKRSERRLQEMLNAPIEEVTVEPMTSRIKEAPIESILDLPVSEPNAPIVIQSIDKLKDAEDSDDEFGENTAARKKSVVTFNENVEKIIHVEEDDTDSSSQSGYEIYKL